MLKKLSKKSKVKEEKKITLFYNISYNYETFFLFLLPELELFCLSALKLKKTNPPKQTKTNTPQASGPFWQT